MEASACMAPSLTMPPSGAQFIFTMRKCSRFHPPDREVLKDITLAFYPGAKIGVLGPNGAGKSTLLRIMAGVDDGYTGEARLTPGFTVGLLEQEPQLDPAKDVIGNVMDGAGESARLLAEYDAVLAGWADPEADYEKLGERQADLEKRIEAAGAWDLKRTVDVAMDALRVPPGDAEVATLSGGERRRVALCRLLLSRPDLLLLDEPTNHLDAESVAWLERFLQDYAGTVVAITHDRYFLDNVAGWILELDRGRGIPFEGNYSSWLEQKQARLAHEEKRDSSRQRTLERELEWVRMAPKARQAKGKARLAAYDKLLAEAKEAEGRSSELELVIPSGDRLGDLVIEVDHLTKGYGDRLLIEDLTFTLPKAGHRRRDRRQRRRQDDPVPDADRRRGARCRLRHDRLDGPARLRGPEPRHARRRQDGVRGDHRRAGRSRGRQSGDPRPGLRGVVQLQGLRPAEVGRRAVRRRAQPGAPGQGAQGGRQRAAARRAHRTTSTSTRSGRSRTGWRPSPAAPS